MDTVMAGPAHEYRSRTANSPSLKTESCHEGDSIFRDKYFDHSQQLEGEALEELLNTNFLDDDDETSSLSTKTITQWRPAHSKVDSHLPETAMSQAYSVTQHQGHPAFRPSSSSDDSPTFQHQQHMFGMPPRPTSTYRPLSNRAYPPSPHGQDLATHQHQVQAQARLMSFGNVHAQVSHGRYVSNSAPVAMPTMSDSYYDVTSHPYFNDDFSSPDNVSRQSTADLMDYEGNLPEEEAADSVNGEIADPCYAQLLYKCLREAPDHTLSLKQVYEWVRQRSQKASSNGTGWQNSVRHNLSMNAAFERVTASALHGAKKGSLWRLTNRALQEGVISTTRYRKDPKRKPERRSSPALKRQSAGAKGGQATRAATQKRKMMQARIASNPNYNGMERHRRDIRRQDHAFFTPTSMSSSNQASPSLQPGWHGLPASKPFHAPPPPSPYYIPSVENEPFTSMPPPSLSNPHTPNEIHVDFDEPPKTMVSPPTAFGSPSKGLTEFELSFHDHCMGGLFGEDNGFDPNTPSLGTEMSFVTDDMTPNSISLSFSVETARS